MKNCLNICGLPRDVLILILSSLHGQDVARCTAVCHAFADLIHSDLALQYRIELAQNGMVDGECSTLPVSERLQRLRQYSSNFKRGAFQHEDLTAHPEYALGNRELGWPRDVISAERPTGGLYKKSDQDDSPLYLSTFIPGSAQGGIPSSRCMFTIREAVKPGMVAETWAMDCVEDLFVVVEKTRISREEGMDGRTPEVFVCFYLLSSLNRTDTMTPHPAATLPFIHIHNVDSAKPTSVIQLLIVGDHVIFEINMRIGNFDDNYWIDVYNWKTGQLVSRIDVGKFLVSIVPLDEPYLLVFRCTRRHELHHDARILIYSFSRSSSESVAGRHVCALQVPSPPPGEHILWSQARSGDHTEETTGHFRTDSSQSVVTIYTLLRGNEVYNAHDNEHITCLLIPRATLTAHIHAAESTSGQTDGTDHDASSKVIPPDQPQPLPPSVPWADWGPRGCLRLDLRSPLFRTQDYVFATPFGSRLPVVLFDGPRNASASMYVFDANPLVARSLRAPRRARDSERDDEDNDNDSEPATSNVKGTRTAKVDDADAPVPRGATALVDIADIEAALPGVVDAECAGIPYVVYRFPLPYSRAGRGAPAVAPDVCAVAMSMTGFTVQFNGSVEYEKTLQTSTV